MAEWMKKFKDSLSRNKREQEELEDFILLQDEPEYNEKFAQGTEMPSVSDATNSSQEDGADIDQLDTTRSLSPDEVKAVVQAQEEMEQIENMDEAVADDEPEFSAFNSQVTSEPQIETPKAEPMPQYPPLEKFEFTQEEEPVVSVPEKVSFFKKHKALILGLSISVGAVVLISTLIMVLALSLNPLRGYSQVAVARGNVIKSMNTTGTMSANAHYSITSLVSGSILKSEYEVGDTVSAGDILYEIDSTEAKIAVERAENALARSKEEGSSSSNSTSKIYSTIGGTVEKVMINSGDKIAAGQTVATVRDSNDNITSIVSMVTGTVSSVSARSGRSIASGGLVATVKDDEVEMKKNLNSYDQKNDQLDINSAKQYLENHTIKSPVDGTVVAKNAKVGDNVRITDMDNPMMVIVDMTSMKFTFSVDETTVWNITPGQSAIINSDSLPNETFAGKVINVSSEGKKNEEGKTMFDVEVLVEDPGELKGGMNVKARVILESATNVLYLPQQALMESDGQNALVIVRGNGDAIAADEMEPEDFEDEDLGGSNENELAFPWIDVPKGCRLVTVKYGIADGTNVEIISGLELGDIVVFDPDKEHRELVSSTASASPSINKNEDAEEVFGSKSTTKPSTASGNSSKENKSKKEDELTEEEMLKNFIESVEEEQAQKKGSTGGSSKKLNGLDL